MHPSLVRSAKNAVALHAVAQSDLKRFLAAHSKREAAFLKALFEILQEGSGLLFVAGSLGCAGDAEAGAHKDMMGRCFHGILQ